MSGFFKKTIQISLILIAFFSIAYRAEAQEAVSDSLSSINLSITPNSPRAGDSVTLTLSSDLLDLDSSKIVWYIDDVARKDTSNKSIIIKAKTNGQKTTIRVVVETSDGITKETSGEISPGGVDLIIEPMAYTLPFYKGKPQFLALGTVKIIAAPDITVSGTKILSKNLNFKWIKDDYVLGSNSGKGRDSIIVNSTIPVRDINITVEILDDGGNVLATNSKLIIKNTPKILFYEDNSLYGVLYNRAITGSYYLGTKEELKIVAKPFSFSFLKDTASEANYVWGVNGNSVSPNEKINELILKQTTTGAKGTASISLDLNNTDKINQYASEAFDVSFGQ